MDTSAENQAIAGNTVSWDKAFKAFFTHSVIVENLLSSFLDPGLVAQLELTSLEPWKAEHVSDKFRERFNNCIWRVRMRTDHGETWLYCFIMVEIQRTVDKSMALRFNEYALMLMQELHNAKQSTLVGDCSPIIPFLISIAEKPWTAPTSIRAMRPPLSQLLDRYQPQMEYILIDAFKFDRSKAGNLFEILLAICNATPDQVLALLDRLPNLLTDEEYGNLCRLFSEWINVAVMMPAGLKAIEPIDLMEDRKMFAARIQEWENKIRADCYNSSKMEIASNMLAAGEPRAKIMQFTAISDKQFDELQGGQANVCRKDTGVGKSNS